MVGSARAVFNGWSIASRVNTTVDDKKAWIANHGCTWRTQSKAIVWACSDGDMKGLETGLRALKQAKEKEHWQTFVFCCRQPYKTSKVEDITKCLTMTCDNATDGTSFPLLERDLKILSFFKLKLFWSSATPSTQTCAQVVVFGGNEEHWQGAWTWSCRFSVL